jgi:hypothetical protein
MTDNPFIRYSSVGWHGTCSLFGAEKRHSSAQVRERKKNMNLNKIFGFMKEKVRSFGYQDGQREEEGMPIDPNYRIYALYHRDPEYAKKMGDPCLTRIAAYSADEAMMTYHVSISGINDSYPTGLRARDMGPAIWEE